MKNKLLHSGFIKAVSFIICTLSVLLFFAGLTVVTICDIHAVYTTNFSDQVEELERNYNAYTVTDEAGNTVIMVPEIDKQAFDYEYYNIVNLYDISYIALGVMIASLIIAIIFFAILMASAGLHKGEEKPGPCFDNKLWFDVELAAFLFTAGLILAGLYYGCDFDYENIVSIVIYSSAIVAITIFGLALFMSFAARVKLGKWWENTLIYSLLKFILKGLKYIGRLIKQCVLLIPGQWLITIAFVLLFLINTIVVMIGGDEADNMLVWFIIEMLVLFPIVIVISSQFKKLKICGDELAKGNLDYKIDTKGMYFSIKEHADSLNRIGDGMSAALDERMKSERMKTELITNVSHDIKTPLTSLINYTDLIMKEKCDNENIKEYASVLHRNSERLKRLMEDIIEASKASSGALDVELAPVDAGMLLSQIAGEYEEKFSEKSLELMLKQPEENIKILADSRRLWRVFDNLFSNICKYSLSGTRVYATMEDKGSHVSYIFKNVSEVALDISPDELTERFVRADASRNTEGNGLGLAIARSLTELQNGTFEVSIDGDLFKVTISFPVIKRDKED